MFNIFINPIYIYEGGISVLKDYVLAKSVDEIIQCFCNHPCDTRVIAGGTDLMLDLESGKVKCGCLIDITGIDELKQIKLENDEIFVGAAVTHNEVNRSEVIKEYAKLLSDACGTVGSLQIRNIGTVIGNVVNAQPAADASIALIALGADAIIKSAAGTTIFPIEELYAGLGKTKVNCNKELVTFVKFPVLKKNQGSSFVRFAQREALSLPILNVAVTLSLKDDATVEWVKIVMAPVGPKPVRAITAESLLKGNALTPELILRASEVALEDANPRDSGLRGSASYRKDILQVLITRALEGALDSIKCKDRG